MRYFPQLILSFLFCGLSLHAIGDEPRVFRFSYEVLPGELPLGEVVDIYIPLPAEHGGQLILEQSFQSSIPGSLGLETRHDNGYYRITRPASSDGPISASLRWTVSRNTVYAGSDMALSDAERVQFLAPNALVPVGHELLQPILKEIRGQRLDESPAATARAIYDWIVENVEYKKVGTGWGNGDTFWACTERYGTLPSDRIHFTTGRDLVMSEASERDPLNYFIYPYVEVGGKPWRGKLKTRFSYREVSVPTLTENGQSHDSL